MKFCPVVPEICRGQVHGPQKERRITRTRIIIIRNGAKTISLQTLFGRLNNSHFKKVNLQFSLFYESVIVSIVPICKHNDTEWRLELIWGIANLSVSKKEEPRCQKGCFLFVVCGVLFIVYLFTWGLLSNDLIFGVLMPLSAIFQLYHGDQF
jgi:hypothetical protein